MTPRYNGKVTARTCTFFKYRRVSVFRGLYYEGELSMKYTQVDNLQVSQVLEDVGLARPIRVTSRFLLHKKRTVLLTKFNLINSVYKAQYVTSNKYKINGSYDNITFIFS